MEKETHQLAIQAGYSTEGEPFVAIVIPMDAMKLQDDGSWRMEITGPTAAYVGTCLIAASRDGKSDAATFLHIAEAAIQEGASKEDSVRIAAKTVREIKQRRNTLPG